jgi:hypothetical protein
MLVEFSLDSGAFCDRRLFAREQSANMMASWLGNDFVWRDNPMRVADRSSAA